MSVSTPAIVASRQAETSREEWAARVELAACYRIFDMLGWTEMIFNHITLRVPGPQRHFLINPYGLWYREVTASNLVKIDLDGNLICPSGIAEVPGITPWNSELLRLSLERGIFMSSRVLAKRMLSPLPPSIRTLLSFTVRMIGSNTRGYRPG